jgi:hypothetical protein
MSYDLPEKTPTSRHQFFALRVQDIQMIQVPDSSLLYPQFLKQSDRADDSTAITEQT